MGACVGCVCYRICILLILMLLGWCACVFAGHSIGVCLSANVSPMNARGSRQQGRPSNGRGLFHVLCLRVCVTPQINQFILILFVCINLCVCSCVGVRVCAAK